LGAPSGPAWRIGIEQEGKGKGTAGFVDEFGEICYNPDHLGGKVSLRGKRVAILAEDLYEELELWYPLLRLREAGADVIVVGTGAKEVYAGKHGYPVEVEATVFGIGTEDIDAVVIPGGYAPDRMRRFPALLDLVRQVFKAGKVVAAICHGGWVLVSAGVLSGRRVTGFVSIKDDLVNAGARYIDRAVVQDGNLITSRVPDDLPAFCQAIIAALED
jgi:protease I